MRLLQVNVTKWGLCLNFDGIIKQRWSRGRQEEVNKTTSRPDGTYGGEARYFYFHRPNFRRFGFLSLIHDLDLAGPLICSKAHAKSGHSTNNTNNTAQPPSSQQRPASREEEEWVEKD